MYSIWPIFHGPVILSHISKTIWCMSVIFSDNETVWPKLWPHSKYKSTWPIFHGLVILLNIFKVIWRMNFIVGIIDQCDTYIDLPSICRPVTYILWSSDFASYLEDCLMEKCCTWDSGSLWLKDWPCKIYSVKKVMDHCSQNVQIVTKEMLPTSKPQTWNTVVSRPLHQNETEPPRRYDAVPLHGYTEKWHYTQTKQEDQQLNFIFWHCEFILTCQTLFHLWSAPWLSSQCSHPDCLCTQ